MGLFSLLGKLFNREASEPIKPKVPERSPRDLYVDELKRVICDRIIKVLDEKQVLSTRIRIDPVRLEDNFSDIRAAALNQSEYVMSTRIRRIEGKGTYLILHFKKGESGNYVRRRNTSRR